MVLLRTATRLASLFLLGSTAWGATSSSATVSWPVTTYLSEPSIHPLRIETNVTGKPATGYTFLATDGSVAFPLGGGPRIIDEDGEDVYIAQGHAFNFGPQIYRHSPVLTWWNGTVFPEPIGRGSGYILIADNTYKIIKNVTLPGNFVTLTPGQRIDSNIDLHEAFITSSNTIIITANNVTTTDLTSVGGPKHGWVVEAQFYEIDIETNGIIFSWKSLDHLDQLPLKDSVYPLGEDGADGTSQDKAWGYFHINAASPLGPGYIISSRFFCSVIAIGRSSHVQWRVQGIHGGDFQLERDTNFCYQHDVRTIFANDKEVVFSIHDNANSPLTEPKPTVATSGLILRLELEKRIASKVERFRNDDEKIYSTAQGNFQLLPRGGALVGHGFTPIIEEFSRDGEILATSQFGPVTRGQGEPQGSIFTYRAFKSLWSACPAHPPKLIAKNVGNQLEIAMSWNGATSISHWTVYAGDSKSHVDKVKQIAKTGFETKTQINCARYVKVEAQGCAHCGPSIFRSSNILTTGCGQGHGTRKTKIL